MKVFITYVIGFTSILVAASTVREATLDEQGKFKLSWSFDGLEKDDYITFNITVETTGWVGLGVSPNGGMTGADIWVAWIDSEGRTFTKDMHATANLLPLEDGSSHDVVLLSSSEENGKTKISLKRKLNTCDKDRDLPITGDTTRVIFAWSLTDPAQNVYTGVDYHFSRRGTKSIFLLEPNSHETSFPDDVITYDITIDDYEIPGDRDTTYYCSFHAAPKLDRKHHIVAMETVITPGNEGLVYHLLLYGCWNVSAEQVQGSNATDAICYSPNMPEFADACRVMTYAWAIGGTKFYFPPHVGMPIGETDSPEYYMVEMHYDNPNKESGRRDSSGVRLTYTPTLRPYEAGITDFGYVAGIFVPPKTERFNVVGYCHESCTDEWIPDNGVKLFAYGLHSHLLGAAIQVDWYRNGSYMGVLIGDKNYDFNFQEHRFLTEEITLLPGDTFKVTCTMNSMERAATTFGGLSTSEEMCLAFFFYYPKQSMSFCTSFPSYLYDLTNSLYTVLGNVSDVPRTNYFTALSNVTWTAELVEKLQQTVYDTPHAVTCLGHDGDFIIPPDEFTTDEFQIDGETSADVCDV